MSFRFRPQVNVLEGREVPASLSALLPDGSVVSGLFSAPAGVDPAQAAQSLPIDDLTVTRGGKEYTVAPGAVANYASGVLLSVVAVAEGPDALSFKRGTVGDGYQSAAVVYDGADTQFTFTLPDGAVGAISYQIPWDQVDPDQASQSLTPIAFNLNLAGQNIATGFTAAPTLKFTNGELIGVEFAADITGGGTPYGRVSISNGIATAIDAATGAVLNATIAAARDSITLDFFGKPKADGAFTLRLTDKDEKNLEVVPVGYRANATPEDLAEAIVTALDGHGTFKAVRNGSKVTISAAAGSKWDKLIYFGPPEVKPAVVTITGRGITFKVSN